MKVLKYVLKVEGLAQIELSELTDFSLGSINLQVLGRKPVSEKSADKYATLFNLPKSIFDKDINATTLFSVDKLLIKKKLNQNDLSKLDLKKVFLFGEITSPEYLCLIADSTRTKIRKELKLSTWEGYEGEYSERFLARLSKRFNVPINLLNSPLSLETKWAIDIHFMANKGEEIISNPMVQILNELDPKQLKYLLKQTPFKNVETLIEKSKELYPTENEVEDTTVLVEDSTDVQLVEDIVKEETIPKSADEDIVKEEKEPTLISRLVEVDNKPALLFEETKNSELELANARIKELEAELQKAYAYIGRKTVLQEF